MNWNILEHIDQLDHIEKTSFNNPQVIFKHSTTCNISTMAKIRLESKWGPDHQEVDFYFLDLHKHRNISNSIEERYSVFHESPQLILIKDGIAEYDASHFDITIEELNESLKFIYG